MTEALKKALARLIAADDALAVARDAVIDREVGSPNYDTISTAYDGCERSFQAAAWDVIWHAKKAGISASAKDGEAQR